MNYDDLRKKTKDSESGMQIRCPARVVLNPDVSDVLRKVPGHLANRPDLIAKHFYHSTDFDWVIPMNNRLSDPVAELVAGFDIAIPLRSRVLALVKLQ